MTLRLLLFSLLLCLPYSNCIAQWEYLPHISPTNKRQDYKKTNSVLAGDNSAKTNEFVLAPDSLELERRAKETTGTNAENLTLKLIKGTTDESQKAYVIFRWITQNIGYDVVGYKQHNLYGQFWNGFGNDKKAMEKNYEIGISNYVIKNKVGTCSGYAYLFKTMCVYAGLEAQYVSGISNTEDIALRTAESDHAWNAIKINGQWNLLDACWASGCCDGKVRTFYKNYSAYYYLTQPEKFILNHLPDDPNWALLKSTPSTKEMLLYPDIQPGYFDKRITELVTKNGILKKDKNNNVKIKVGITEEIDWKVQGVAANGDVVTLKFNTFGSPNRQEIAVLVPSKCKSLMLITENDIALIYDIEM